jgi:hypothetical protein
MAADALMVREREAEAKKELGGRARQTSRKKKS